MTVYDIAVIGCGPAGLELWEMLHKTYAMAMIERGRLSFNLEDQRSFGCESVGRTIRSGPLDTRSDAEHHLARYSGFGGTYTIWGGIWKAMTPRDFAKWPISYEELLPYYHETASFHNVREVLDIPDVQCKVDKGVEELKIAKAYKQMKEHLFLESPCIGFSYRANKIDGVLIKTRGQESIVRARVYVLAAGTIESTRILLNEKKVNNALLGKRLMDHPKGYVGTLVSLENAQGYLPFGDQGRIFKRGICLDDTDLPHHCLLLKKVPGGYEMRFHLEQLPNSDSSITLSDKQDVYGRLIPRLNWRLMDQETSLFQEFFRRINHELGVRGIGKVVYSEKDITLEHFRDASHQMGTICMGKTAHDGVVNPHLQVFGHENLFVLSNAVFPNGGSANPTLTLLALARRLGGYLKQNL